VNICFLSPAEVKRWNLHEQPPARCSRREHSHVDEQRARELCAEGLAELAMIGGAWRLLPTNPKTSWKPRRSGPVRVWQAR